MDRVAFRAGGVAVGADEFNGRVKRSVIQRAFFTAGNLIHFVDHRFGLLGRYTLAMGVKGGIEQPMRFDHMLARFRRGDMAFVHRQVLRMGGCIVTAGLINIAADDQSLQRLAFAVASARQQHRRIDRLKAAIAKALLRRELRP